MSFSCSTDEVVHQFLSVNFSQNVRVCGSSQGWSWS